MRKNENAAMLYETLLRLCKGKEELAYEYYSRIAIHASIDATLPEIVNAASEVTGESTFTISEHYYKVRNQFATYKFDYFILSENDASWPKGFKNSGFHFLYGAGDITLLEKKVLAITGMRLPSDEGKKAAATAAKEAFASLYAVASTLDYGIDSYSLMYALNERIPVIALLASPLHQCVPESQKELMVSIANNGGLLLTPFAPCQKAEKWFNVPRNRALVALSDALAVAEEKDGGPSWRLASLVKEKGDVVFVFKSSLENDSYTYAKRFSSEENVHIWSKSGDIKRVLSEKKIRRKKKNNEEQLELF